MNEKALRVRYQKNKVKKERWKMYDVIIIGAGVSGAAAARELSRYNAKVCVIEKEEDVCCGTSKANSAIVHAGYDAKEGSLMAKLNVRGNAMMEQLSKELDFPFQRIGSLVVCRDEADMPNLKALYDRSVANGVPGLRILSKEEVHEMEPNLEGFYMKHTVILIQINIIFKVRFRNFLAETITVVTLSNLTTLKKSNKSMFS